MRIIREYVDFGEDRGMIIDPSMNIIITSATTTIIIIIISGSMLTSVKMEEEEGCEQLDDYSFSILEGILPQVLIMMVILEMMVTVKVMVMIVMMMKVSMLVLVYQLCIKITQSMILTTLLYSTSCSNIYQSNQVLKIMIWVIKSIAFSF